MTQRQSLIWTLSYSFLVRKINHLLLGKNLNCCILSPLIKLLISYTNFCNNWIVEAQPFIPFALALVWALGFVCLSPLLGLSALITKWCKLKRWFKKNRTKRMVRKKKVFRKRKKVWECEKKVIVTIHPCILLQSSSISIPIHFYSTHTYTWQMYPQRITTFVFTIIPYDNNITTRSSNIMKLESET